VTTLSSVSIFIPKSKVAMVILKEVLKAAREERGLRYEELAEAVCLKKWHIIEIEEAESFRTFYSYQITSGQEDRQISRPFRGTVFIFK
jgi:transcriptional regulator with XRE-family HTH domain